MPKSLMEFICESIDEVLPPDCGVSGREIYLRGCERFETAHFEREMKRKRREFEASMPILVPADSEVIEEWNSTEPNGQ